MTYADALKTFSAALPAITGAPSRLWNGRALTPDEVRGAAEASRIELERTGSPWFAAQAAHEWLSERAW